MTAQRPTARARVAGSIVVAAIVGLAVFLVVIGAAAGGVFILFISVAAGLVWFLLFSGRVRTATPVFRARLVHIAFTGFFVLYGFGIVMWLTAGLIAAIAGHSPAFHERMHAYGGAPAVLSVSVSDIEPFNIDGSSRIREMTLRAGRRSTIEFTNEACEYACGAGDEVPEPAAFEHNISIYRLSGEPVFVGARIRPSESDADPGPDPVTATYTFDTPEPGMYEYRCDVYPLVMRGSVRVLPAAVPLTHPQEDPGFRDDSRRIAAVSHQAEDVSDIILDYAFSAVSLGLGIFLVLLRPRERMARIFGVAMIGTAAAYNLQSHSALATIEPFDFLHSLLHPITGVTYIYALVLFPDGRLIPRFSRPMLRLGYRVAFFIAAMILLGITGAVLPDFNQHPAALVLTFGMAIPVIGMVAQGYRLRRAPSSEARQQSRLLLIALAASFAFGLIVLLVLGIDLRTLFQPDAADTTAINVADGRAFRAFQPLFVVIPLALFAGILRYRLWDIDLVIRRTIVYGALAAFIGAVYVGVVVGLGGAVGGRTGLSIAATVLVAVAFDPLRSRLQRIANRLVYGERASPYDVMADVSHRLAGMTSPAQALPAIAEAVARGVGAERARVTLVTPGGDRVEVTYPPDDPGTAPYDRTLPIAHQSEPVGELAVGKRPGDPLRAAENRLLEAIGSQVALALHGLRLTERLRTRLEDLKRTTAQLERSRHRIVSAQDAERSRLEREIHDRVESRLIAIDAMVEQAERASKAGARTAALLEEAAAEANRVQDTLRDLARGIFPPLLSDRGVTSALEGYARKIGASVAVRASGLGGRFDPNAEAAVYFCCIEAIRSAARRADGSRIRVDLAVDDDWVSFEVRDRAHGLSDAAMTGADLQLIVDRVEAVGGRMEIVASPEGTTISGKVPLQPLDADHSTASRSGSKADLLT